MLVKDEPTFKLLSGEPLVDYNDKKTILAYKKKHCEVFNTIILPTSHSVLSLGPEPDSDRTEYDYIEDLESTPFS